MSNRDEYEAWMFGTYGDFADVIKQEGINCVLIDLEHSFPEVYRSLIDGIFERAKLNKEKPCLLLQTPDSSNGESR